MAVVRTCKGGGSSGRAKRDSRAVSLGKNTRLSAMEVLISSSMRPEGLTKCVTMVSLFITDEEGRALTK